jgi:RNA polymerase sigma-70 factor (ECF subfamily)
MPTKRGEVLLQQAEIFAGERARSETRKIQEPMNTPESNTPESTGGGGYPTTQWTQVIAVIQKGDDVAVEGAINDFCGSYRMAVYHFFRRQGCSHETAEDYCQEFFITRILEPLACRQGFLLTAERREERRFRSFLCHVLWRFIQDKWKEQRRARSGGGVPHVPLEEVMDFDIGGGDEVFRRFGCRFDREFAWQIIQRAANRSPHSSYLLAHLKGEMPQRDAAAQLGLAAGAFKIAYHRFRERIARDLWDEVARLVGPDEGEIRAEIRYLMSLFQEPSA